MRMRTGWRVVSGPARTAGGRCPTWPGAGCPTLGSGLSSRPHDRRRRHDLDTAADPARPRAEVDAEIAERANLLALRLGQRPPHTHDYELSGEIQ